MYGWGLPSYGAPSLLFFGYPREEPWPRATLVEPVVGV